MKVVINTPLEKQGAKFKDENLQKWNSLNRREKLFYKYLIENDTSLSSILVGVFSAYVVNIFSNLVSLQFSHWLYFVLYCLNAFVAVRVLCLFVMLYSIHARKERKDRNDNDEVYLNKSFEVIFSSQKVRIKKILSKLTRSFVFLLLTILLCCGFNNHIHRIIYDYILNIINYAGDILNVINN